MVDMNKILKQAQEMQKQALKVQDELAGREVEASSGGGMVKTIVNGKQEVLSIVIDPQVVDSKDVEMLQDLIIAAVNQAIKKSQDLFQTEMGKLAGGFGIPGLEL